MDSLLTKISKILCLVGALVYLVPSFFIAFVFYSSGESYESAAVEAYSKSVDGKTKLYKTDTDGKEVELHVYDESLYGFAYKSLSSEERKNLTAEEKSEYDSRENKYNRSAVEENDKTVTQALARLENQKTATDNIARNLNFVCLGNYYLPISFLLIGLGLLLGFFLKSAKKSSKMLMLSGACCALVCSIIIFYLKLGLIVDEIENSLWNINSVTMMLWTVVMLIFTVGIFVIGSKNSGRPSNAKYSTDSLLAKISKIFCIVGAFIYLVPSLFISFVSYNSAESYDYLKDAVAGEAYFKSVDDDKTKLYRINADGEEVELHVYDESLYGFAYSSSSSDEDKNLTDAIEENDKSVTRALERLDALQTETNNIVRNLNFICLGNYYLPVSFLLISFGLILSLFLKLTEKSDKKLILSSACCMIIYSIVIFSLKLGLIPEGGIENGLLTENSTAMVFWMVVMLIFTAGISAIGFKYSGSLSNTKRNLGLCVVALSIIQLLLYFDFSTSDKVNFFVSLTNPLAFTYYPPKLFCWFTLVTSLVLCLSFWAKGDEEEDVLK